MNNEYELLTQILRQWSQVTKKRMNEREKSMQIMCRSDELLLKQSFIAWKRLKKRINTYRKTRDLFYKKLLIFNYHYTLRKYFNGFKLFNQRLITNHYKKEVANNFRSQKLEILKIKVMKEIKLFVNVQQNGKQLISILKKKYFKWWLQAQRQSQLSKKLEQEQESMNDIEKWVSEKRNARIQPKLQKQQQQQQIDLQNTIIKQKQPQFSHEQELQQTPVKQCDIPEDLEMLNQYLQLKMMEYDYINKLPNKQIEVIRSVKMEIKNTLLKIQSLKN